MEPYKKQQDGSRAWRGIVAKYKADGNKNVRIHRLELVISRVFTKGYTGGLLAEDSENLRLNAERLASYKSDLDAGNYKTKTIGSSDDFSHTGTQTHSDSAPLGETVCLNIHADTVLDMDNNQIPHDYTSGIIWTSDPHASRLSRALSKKVDLDSLAGAQLTSYMRH
jgi:hypothetical protein